MKRKLPGCLLTTAMLVSISAVTNAAPSFQDFESTHWAGPAVEELAASGILLGYPDGTYKGAQYATRYEAAAISARVITDLQQKFNDSLQKTALPIISTQDSIKQDIDSLNGKIEQLQKSLNDGIDYKVDLSSVEETINGMSDKIDKLELKEKETQSSISAIASQFNDLKTRISMPDTSDIDDLNSNILDIKATISNLEKRLQDSLNSQTISKLEEQFNTLSEATSDAALRSIIETAIAKELNLRGYLTAAEVEQKASEAAENVMNEVVKLRGEVVAIDGKVSTLDELCKSLVSKTKADIDERLRQLSEAQQSLTIEIEGYKTKLATLEDKLDVRLKLASAEYDNRFKELSEKIDSAVSIVDSRLSGDLNKVKTELSDEINQLKLLFTQISPELSSVSETVENLQNAVEEMKVNLSKLDGERAANQERIRSEIYDLGRRIGALEGRQAQGSLSDQKIDTIEKDIDSLKTVMEDLKKDAALRSAEINKLNDDMAKAAFNTAEISAQVGSVKPDALQPETNIESLNDVQNNANAQKTDIMATNADRVKTLMEDISEAVAARNNAGLNDDIKQTASDTAGVSGTEFLNDTVNDVEPEPTKPYFQHSDITDQKIDALQKNIDVLKTVIDNLNEDTAVKGNKVDQISSDLQRTVSDVAIISQQVGNVESETAQIEKDIKRLDDAVGIVESQLTKSNTQLENIVEALNKTNTDVNAYNAAVNERVDSIEDLLGVKADVSDIESAFASYKQQAETRIQSLIDYQRNLEEKIVRLDELIIKLTGELASNKVQSERAIAAAENAVVKADMANAATENISKEISSVKAEIANVAADLSNSKANSDARLSHVEEMTNTTAKLIESAGARRDTDIANVQQGLDGAFKQIANVEEGLNKSASRLLAAESGVDRILHDIEEINAKTDINQRTTDANTESIFEISKTAKALESKLAALESEVQSTMTAVDSKAEDAAEAIIGVKDEIKSVVSRVDDLTGRIDSAEKSLVYIGNKVDSEASATRQNAADINLWLDEVDKKADKLDMLSARIDYLEKSLPEMTRNINTARNFGIFGTVLSTIVGIFSIVK